MQCRFGIQNFVVYIAIHRPGPDWPAYCRRCASSSCRSANRVLERQLIPAFGRLPLDAIRRIDVERWFDAYSRTAPGGANKALEILGQIMNAALAAAHVSDRDLQAAAERIGKAIESAMETGESRADVSS